MAVAAVLPVWAVVELAVLWRPPVGLRALVHAQRYTPGATALLLGIGSGILYLGFGPWTYTNSLQATVGSLMGERLSPPALQLVLIPALFTGMLVSTGQRGAWRARKRLRGGPANVTGGIFLGLGGTLIPGGNDTLLLRLIPSMAPGSLWSYLMLILGVICGLLLQRRVFGAPCESVDCRDAG